MKSAHGTQDASQIWQDDYVELLISGGFKRGKSNGVVFYLPERDVCVLVHGDEFLVLAIQDCVDEFERLLASRCEYKKTGNLGFEPSDDASLCFLNRVISVAEGKPRRVMVEPSR